jgi:cytochrome c oxidase subunit 2
MNVFDGPQSAFAPAGPEAHEIARTAWLLFGGAAAILVIVVVLASIAIVRRPRWLASRSTVLVGGFVVPLVVLGALLVDSLSGSPRLLASTTHPKLAVEIVGHQWWWRVAYLDDRGRPDFETANEVRVPVGVPVELMLRSDDVLHSFWVPPLAGKLDMIPGRTNRLVIVADRAGAWRGQCAEYCGTAHAQMALHVIAQPADVFERWRDAQRADAKRVEDAHAQGYALFQARCGVCHAVRGTEAAGERGPDLTHVATRVSIGGGILPNDAASIERWIASNQRIKPGNLMPEFDEFTQEELRAVTAYLAGLD